MATTVVPTNNPLITSTFVDADESTYNETPTEKQTELRVAAIPAGSGALVEARNSTSQIVEAERVGQSIDLLTSAAGYSSDANVTATTVASAPTGYSGNSLELQGLAASSTDRGSRLTFGAALNLSVYGGATLFLVHRRISSITNLLRAVIRFEFATSSDWAQYELAAAGTTLNTWAEISVAKGSPQSTSGTVDWSNVKAIRFFFDVSGAYTGNLDVRDLRIGTTRTGKTTPDGHLAYESSYDFRVRYSDPMGFGPWSGWSTIKPSQPPTITPTSPANGASVTTPTPTYAFTYSSPGGKAQAARYVDLYEVVGGQDQFVARYSVTGTGTSIVQPSLVLASGRTYAWVPSAIDTDGLLGVGTRRTFTTTFSQPSAPTGVTVTTDEDASSATIAWATALGSAYEFRVYRRITGGILTRISPNGKTWAEGDPIVTASPLVDYHVPENVGVEYLVSVHSGSASGEGESATTSGSGSITLDRYMNVIPGVPSRTFEIRYVRGFRATPVLQEERTEIIERTTMHVSLGELLEPEITFDLWLDRGDRDILDNLRAISVDDALPYAILKTPRGDVWRVQYGTIPAGYEEGGFTTSSITADVIST